jgi:hypothetical protein
MEHDLFGKPVSTFPDHALAPPDGNRAGNRTGPRAKRMTVIAGLDDPFAVFFTDDLSDVVRPNNHRSYSRRSRPAPTRPVACEIE